MAARYVMFGLIAAAFMTTPAFAVTPTPTDATLSSTYYNTTVYGVNSVTLGIPAFQTAFQAATPIALTSPIPAVVCVAAGTATADAYAAFFVAVAAALGSAYTNGTAIAAGGWTNAQKLGYTTQAAITINTPAYNQTLCALASKTVVAVWTYSFAAFNASTDAGFSGLEGKFATVLRLQIITAIGGAQYIAGRIAVQSKYTTTLRRHLLALSDAFQVTIPITASGVTAGAGTLASGLQSNATFLATLNAAAIAAGIAGTATAGGTISASPMTSPSLATFMMMSFALLGLSAMTYGF